MDAIDELLTRGVANIIPSGDELKKLLSSEKKLNIYFGIDPTMTKIHMGHSVPLRIIQKLSDLDHNVIFLIGDFTALVGDTSDKDSERPSLTKEEIERNFQTYKKQAEKILDFSKVNIRYNSEWLSELSFDKILELVNYFSLNDFISRELIKKRLNEGGRVGLAETLYPLMQAYDSYMLKTDLQVGGTDQTFNMQAGRALIKALDNRESFVLTTEFLMGTDGRKMSKSWGNAIWLTDEPFEMYRKIMAINDEQIRNYYLLTTNIPTEEIPTESEISKNPLNVKKKLAHKIVSEFHSEADARKAQNEFERTVQKGQLPHNLTEVDVAADRLIDGDLLIELGLATSRSEAKRLFEQNGVRVDGKQISPGQTLVNESGKGIVLSVGKRVVKLKLNV